MKLPATAPPAPPLPPPVVPYELVTVNVPPNPPAVLPIPSLPPPANTVVVLIK